MNGPAIELERLSLTYGDHCVLGPISHRFAPSKCHVVMGPNGGGKTSLLRSLLGLTAFSGHIHIDWPCAQGRVAYVPQKASFEPSLPLTVMDFLLLNQSRVPLFWRRKSQTMARIDEQLLSLGMGGKGDRKMGRLSGGEQQRVLFAQALLDQPDLLMLDEPANGMDEQGIGLIEGMISELVRQGATVVAVHHDVNAIKRIADQVHLVNQQLLSSGDVASVLGQWQPTDLFGLSQNNNRQALA